MNSNQRRGHKSYWQRKEELKAAYNLYAATPTNRRIKYGAIVSITLAILSHLVCIIFLARISWPLLLTLRILAGIFALVFAILLMLLTYRINRAYWHHRSPHP